MTAAAFLFFAALLLLAYTFVGYPLLLAIWARIAERPVDKSSDTPPVAFVVVVHNGAGLIRKKIETCLAQDYPPDRLRILIVSDGSDDETSDIVTGYGDPRVQLLPLPQRRGKTAGLNDAIATCAEEILILTDVRQALDQQAVRRLVANFADTSIGAVSGQLMFERDDITDFGEGIDAYWRYEKFLRHTESRIHSSVGVTGALYALRRSCFRPIPPQTVLDDVLIPMNVVAQGYRVIFEQGALAYDRPSRNAAQERIRKVRTLAGNFQLMAGNPWLLVPWRNPIAMQFISHKLMRLIAPLAMFVALSANAMLAAGVTGGVLWRLTFAAQLSIYAIAILGLLSPVANRLRPVRIASAFLSLNWFVVLGFVEFLSNRNLQLWQNHQQPASRPGSAT